MNRDELIAYWDTLTNTQRGALIAERVFGHTVRWLRDPIWDEEPKPWIVGDHILGGGSYRLLDESGAAIDVRGRMAPDFSRIESAWDVVVALRERGCDMAIGPGSVPLTWAARVVLPTGRIEVVESDPVARAICLAALLALATAGE